MKEYGGWGIRDSPGVRNKAFTMQGTIGSQLEFIDDCPVLLGTTNPEEVQRVLKEMWRLQQAYSFRSGGTCGTLVRTPRFTSQ